jgi:formate-dependent nitrite reductase membrane component NrfD
LRAVDKGVIICPILLTLDLGKPLDFWHMLINTSSGGPSFKAWSPMSLGAWGLLVFGAFSFVMFVVALARAVTCVVARWSALDGCRPTSPAWSS